MNTLIMHYGYEPCDAAIGHFITTLGYNNNILYASFLKSMC